MAPDAGKARLKISLLGPPEVRLENSPLVIPRKMTRALLYYLACQNQPVDRITLCNLLWSSTPETQARKNLREQLSLLRKALGSDDFIIVSGDLIHIDSSLVYVDSRQFHEVIDRVHVNLDSLPTGKLPESLYRTLRESINLWRTPYFMQGVNMSDQVEYDTWMYSTGTRYEYWRQKIAERLADHEINLGNLEEAVRWLRSALESDPLNTDLHYLVLTCLRDLGKTKTIQKYEELLQKTYVQENGEEIPQLLVDFFSHVRDLSNFTFDLRSQNWPGVSHSNTKFVGRITPLHELNQYLMQGGMVLIKGESGIGKSRLMEEFYTRLEIPVRLLYCAARPMEVTLPFQPVIDGLKKCVTEEEWDSLPDNVVASLFSMFPKLEINRKVQPLMNPEGNGFTYTYWTVLESLLVLFQTLAKKYRLLIVLDDAQWCDEATLALLSFLNERGFFQSSGFLLIASQISNENQKVDDFVKRNENSESFHQILLEGLSEEEISDLVYLLLGKAVSSTAIQKLARDTAGNPLFVIEIIKNMMGLYKDSEEITLLDHFPIPHNVQSIIAEHIKEIDADSLAVLSSAAMLGSTFTPDLIEVACHLPQEEIVIALDKLEKTHTIVSMPEMKPVGGYAFTHDQIRQTLLNGLSPARKRMYALRSISAIKEKYRESLSYAAIIAHLYEIAGEILPAFRAWINAAIFSRLHFSQKDSYSAFRQALNLCKKYEDLFTEQDLYDFLTKWADYAYDLADIPTCEEIYTACVTFGEHQRSALLIGAGISGQARVAGLCNQQVRGLVLLDFAQKYLEKAGSEGELIEVLVRRGVLNNQIGDYSKARGFLEKALRFPCHEISWRIRDAMFNARIALTLDYCLMGYPKKAEETAREAYLEGEFLERGLAKFQARTMLAISSFFQAKYHSAIQIAIEALAEAEDLNQAWWNSLLYLTISRSYVYTGYLDRAWEMSERALHYSEASRTDYLISQVYCVKGELFRVMEDFDRAKQYFNRGIRENADDFQTLENSYLFGYVTALDGDLETGIARIRRTMQIAQKKHMGMITIPAQSVLYAINDEEEENITEKLLLLRRKSLQQGFGLSPLMLRIANARLLAKHLEYQKAENELDLAAREARAVTSPWIELSVYRMILEDVHFSYSAKKQAETRVRSIFDFLEENAGSEPCKSGLEKLRSAW